MTEFVKRRGWAPRVRYPTLTREEDVLLHASSRSERATDRGDLLVVSPDAPGPLDQGFRIRVHHLAAALAEAGYRVTLLAPPAGPDGDDALDRLGVEVVAAGTSIVRPVERRQARISRALRLLAGYPPPGALAARADTMRPTLARLLAERAFDAVQVEVPEFVEAASTSDAPVVLDAHNIWWELTARRQTIDPWAMRRAVRAIGLRPQRMREERAWRRADLCLTTSEREGAIVRAAGARRVAVVPNGVDPDAHQPMDGLGAGGDPGRGGNADAPTLVFVGLLGYEPNADAVTHLIRDILPLIHEDRPGVHVQVVGDGASAELLRLARPGVVFTGRVPDVRPYVTAADAVVVPLRSGSGTRFKILEALALGRPVVTTTMGGEGLDLIDGQHALIADGPSAFARAVGRVLSDDRLARELGTNGRALVKQSYGWPEIGARLAEAYDQLLGRAG